MRAKTHKRTKAHAHTTLTTRAHTHVTHTYHIHTHTLHTEKHWKIELERKRDGRERNSPDSSAKVAK